MRLFVIASCAALALSAAGPVQAGPGQKGGKGRVEAKQSAKQRRAATRGEARARTRSTRRQVRPKSGHRSKKMRKVMRSRDRGQEKTRGQESNKLAKQRTLLAAERTFHAYVRTALSSAVAGLSMHQLGDALVSSGSMEIAGGLLLGASVPTLALGAWRYLKQRKQLAGDR